MYIECALFQYIAYTKLFDDPTGLQVSWGNWYNVGDCQTTCCNIGGHVTQIRACAVYVRDNSAFLPCNHYGSTSRVVACAQACPMCSQGWFLFNSYSNCDYN